MLADICTQILLKFRKMSANFDKPLPKSTDLSNFCGGNSAKFSAKFCISFSVFLKMFAGFDKNHWIFLVWMLDVPCLQISDFGSVSKVIVRNCVESENVELFSLTNYKGTPC